jgi:signal transduction histidine kinase
MVEPDVLHGDSNRPCLTQRLYWRIYLALLASLTVAATLFGLAHLRYGAALAAMQGFGSHLAMLALLLAIAVVVAVAAFPVVRRLTRRLERLQASVDAWGTGDLSSRVAVEGRDEVAQLAMSFNQSARRIEALVSAQRILLANASHELRSPLARIRMAI